MKLLGESLVSDASVEIVLELLRRVIAPAGVIHVGAGDGRGPLNGWHSWHLSNRILIDADAECLSWVTERFDDDASVFVFDAVLAEKAGETTFYDLSLSSASGLLSAEQLKSIYPSIAFEEERAVVAVTLDSILEEGNASWFKPENAWLLVDSLAASSILRGSSKVLSHINVVCATVLADETGVNDACSTEVAKLLRDSGFHEVAVFPSNHPKIGYGVFCRDVIGATAKKLSEQNQSLIDLNTEKESLLEQVKRFADAELSAKKAEEGVKSELTAIKQAHAELQKQLEGKVAELKGLQSSFDTVRAEKEELDQRQQIMTDEIAKAESQIELIKELLLLDKNP